MIKFYKRVINARKQVKNNQQYLKNGIYFMDYELRSVVLNKNHSKKQFNSYIKGNYHIKEKLGISKVIKSLLTSLPIIIKSRSKLFFGDALLFSNELNITREFKIFDFEKSEVISQHLKEKTFSSELKFYKFFSEHFKIPKIKLVNEKKLYYIEELINVKQYNEWNNNDYDIVVNKLYEKFYDYHLNCQQSYNKQKNVDFLKYFNAIQKNAALKELNETIISNLDSRYLNIGIPSILSHSDLWLRNILLSKNREVYFIDWEHAREHSIFYDLLFYIQNEYVYNNNVIPLKNFLEKNNNNNFGEILKLYNLSNEVNDRKNYFLLFLIEFLYFRLNNVGVNTSKIISKYIKLIENLNKYM